MLHHEDKKYIFAKGIKKLFKIFRKKIFIASQNQYFVFSK